MKKRLKKWAALLLCLCFCAGCQSTTPPQEEETPLVPMEPEPEPAPVIVPGQKTDITLAYSPADSLNPFQVTTEYNAYLLPLIYESLFVVDGDYAIKPLLCESYEGDGTTWTLQLRQGVQFHNGQELTARDVEYSINQARSSTVFASRVQNIASCQASGRYGVRIRLATPDSKLPWLLTTPIVQRNAGAQPNPAGTGRFVVEAADGTAKLVANTGWHGGQVGVGSISLSALYQDSALSYIIGSGVIDAVCFEKPFATSVPLRGDFDVATFATGDFHYLGINKSHSQLQNPLVRRAISAGIDRELLVQKAFSGYGDPTLLPIAPASSPYQAELGDGEALLRQAGFSDTDGDGIYNDTQGKNLVFTLLVPAENEMKRQGAEIVAQSLLGSGIKIEVQALAAEEFAQAVAADRFDLFYGETLLNDQFDLTQMVTAGGSLCYGGASVAVATYMNATKNAQPQGLEQVQKDLYRIFGEDMPFVPMAFGRGCIITGKDVMHPVQGAGRNPYYNLHQWAGATAAK